MPRVPLKPNPSQGLKRATIHHQVTGASNILIHSLQDITSR